MLLSRLEKWRTRTAVYVRSLPSVAGKRICFLFYGRYPRYFFSFWEHFSHRIPEEAVFSFCRAACFRTVEAMAGMLSCTMSPMPCNSLKVCIVLERKKANESIWLFCSMDMFFQKLQAVANPTAFAAVFPQVIIIPCDGNLGMGGEAGQADVALFSQAVYRHQFFLLLA